MSVFDLVKPREGTVFAARSSSYTKRTAQEVVLANLNDDIMQAQRGYESGNYFRTSGDEAMFALRYGELVAVKQTGLTHNVLPKASLVTLMEAVRDDAKAGKYDDVLTPLETKQKERLAAVRAAWNALSPEEKAARKAAKKAEAPNVAA